MDGFIAHRKCVEDPERLIAMNQLNVHVLFLPPHSSDQIQPLDLVTFNLQKLWKKKADYSKRLSYQSKQILEGFNSLLMASTPHYIKCSFERAGIRRSLFGINENGEFIKQFHIVDIKLNKVIRGLELEDFDRDSFVSSLQPHLRKTIPISLLE